MRYLILVLFFVGCAKQQVRYSEESVKQTPYYGDAGNGKSLNVECDDHDQGFRVKAIRCFMEFITGGDSGGTWQVSIKPVESNIQTRLIGDNPCLEWSTETCGAYRFLYIVGDVCCRDTAIVNINKCCLIGISMCD